MGQKRKMRNVRAVGQDWEDAILMENELLETQGKGRVRKSHEPLKPIKHMRGGKVMAVYTKKSEPDYVGTLDGGRSVRFEAKTTKCATRFPFSEVKPHQRKALAECSALGAVSFVYVAKRGRDRGLVSYSYFILPVSPEGVIAGVTGRKSFPFPDVLAESPYFKLGRESWLDTYRRLEAEGLA